MNQEYVIEENYTQISHQKTPEDISIIKQNLKNHFVFSHLQEDQLDNLISKMFYCETQKDQYLIKEGDSASTFFILQQGKIELQIKQVPKRQILPGEAFGELALLYNAPRSASCKAFEKCFMWAIDRNTFQFIVQDMINKQYDENRNFVEKHQFFQNLTVNQKDSVAAVLMNQHYQKGEFIVHENDQASSFYLIKKGEVNAIKGEQFVRTLQCGDSFGEAALIPGNHTRFMSIQANTNVQVSVLARDTLNKILGERVDILIYKNTSKWIIEKMQGYQSLTKQQKEFFINNLQIIQYKNNQVVLNKNTLIKQQIIIVLEGQIIKNNDTFLQKGQFIGEKEAFSQENNDIFDEDLVIIGPECKLGVIQIDKLEKQLGNLYQLTLKNQENSVKEVEEKNREKCILNSMTLQDFEVVKKLGFGQFGSVYLVKKGDNLYSMKCISKAQVSKENLQKHIINEKVVMQFNDFPFIMRFLRSFKDERCIYFLLEYIQGVELFDGIRQIGLLGTYDSQFYIGSIILMLEYLHGNNIIYRDLKPENIMVDKFGYLKLIDMGTAKIMKKENNVVRTFTIIGTPHYMAPEVIQGKGYSFLADLWSVGIILYEFMSGFVPYAEEADDPYEIYEEIIRKNIDFPDYMNDEIAKEFIKQLLSKVPEIRIGGSFQNLKNNIWFKNFDWLALYEKRLKPAYIPVIQDFYFENTYTNIKNIEEVVKAEGIQSVQNVKLRGKKYDPTWEEAF
ncbi:hypothetical protein IMG5_201250 [Ichthyophthirius multifiliis]|uniref:cGMP-dependent protein kinase n=1 Tax=Ichthyophthirius multifiliis TaxID=5932 RepID=G0R5X9_ICHMU|nr:hypothetical protein IMG5_201250 [Ichthyophthirius multifiliis]EGR27103.1 hypothetical protein IMG5_201250 [Ichthyophthirius multifiliis]|eukprot:XP_004023987.1 hypothetical protein IMG5_201250 [Ichthyophthirius multifiliis]